MQFVFLAILFSSQESPRSNSCDILFQHPCWLSRNCFCCNFYRHDLCPERTGFLVPRIRPKVQYLPPHTHAQVAAIGRVPLVMWHIPKDAT